MAVLQARCRKSSECPDKDVCDRTEKVCRPTKRPEPVSKAALAKECLRRGIPVSYERGPHKGERKTREALRSCSRQKDRNVVPYDASKVRLLVAPPQAPPSLRPATATEFVRPKEVELRNMNKTQLTQLFNQGKVAGFIDPSKSAADFTNAQLINAIRRATKKLF